ncbi:GNAT family N-acetyltransferase [Treponema phagedenis]|uniref:Acetyltransferase, GNAT family n=1 Tax=Treponema phagedenis TaxID=162 RepID=A0A0B7H1L2_TREPH|nr:GNAT family N-acetyltransferase [Treponema phagedenis]EFW37684.1 acetyltransferase, GNAT family [Treponema phagedenis F0421]NVP24489.1 GNAT family N-acetyltransferase [Treponema phagedenis]QEJ95507.1 GNAT family N-acetyltransferase [Treponema phagedenis]QEJ97751.1 GNAT family N-acetyltransferase [Treponema phagedenis]QEK01360.1 GNAT family N-acetyltransferase [Treponema phagedenis]
MLTDYRIIKLHKNDLACKIPVKYKTPSYFDLQINRDGGGDAFKLIKKDFEKLTEKRYTINLFEEAGAMVYGVENENEVIGFIEMIQQKWIRRLRILNIYVKSKYRSHHIGSLLLEFAESRAAHLHCRAVVLDTESCNYNAIRFYQKHGFQITGFDTLCYTNNDVALHEFRIDLAKQIYS